MNGSQSFAVGFGGDGGTGDMGIQALSGAAHRDENILYIFQISQMPAILLLSFM